MSSEHYGFAIVGDFVGDAEDSEHHMTIQCSRRCEVEGSFDDPERK